MPAVKKIDFSEYYNTFVEVLNNIDTQIQTIKNRQKKLPVYHGYDSYKDFLKGVEDKAIKNVSSNSELTPATIRERWHVLTMPSPVYCAIESDEISFSKARNLLKIQFDFENDDSIVIADEIVDAIKGGLKVAEIKELVEKKSPEIWNESTVVISRIMEQHGITSDSIF